MSSKRGTGAGVAVGVADENDLGVAESLSAAIVLDVGCAGVADGEVTLDSAQIDLAKPTVNASTAKPMARNVRLILASVR